MSELLSSLWSSDDLSAHGLCLLWRPELIWTNVTDAVIGLAYYSMSGLGLSQVYGFVQQSGGIVRLDSSLSEGTRVTIHLPVISSSITNKEIVFIVEDEF
jgi:hypothetical protein